MNQFYREWNQRKSRACFMYTRNRSTDFFMKTKQKVMEKVFVPVIVILPVENIFNEAESSGILYVTPGWSSGSYLNTIIFNLLFLKVSWKYLKLHKLYINENLLGPSSVTHGEWSYFNWPWHKTSSHYVDDFKISEANFESELLQRSGGSAGSDFWFIFSLGTGYCNLAGRPDCRCGVGSTEFHRDHLWKKKNIRLFTNRYEMEQYRISCKYNDIRTSVAGLNNFFK